MKQQASRYHATKFSELEVYTEKRLRKDGRYNIKGIPVESGTGIGFEGIAAVSEIAADKAAIEETVNRIVYRLEETYRLLYRNGAEDGNKVAVDTCICLNNILSQIDKSDFRINPRWTSRDANRAAVTYFISHTMKWLKPFLNGEKEFLPQTDTRELIDMLRKDIGSSSRSVDSQTVERSVNRRMYEASTILLWLYQNVEGFPSIRLEYDQSAQAGSVNEQPKYISTKVFREYCEILKKESKIEPKTVLCALVQVHGARTAEAAATKPCDFFFSEEYANVNIFNQEKQGKRTPILKTNVSNRVIVLGDWGTAIVKLCLSNLPKDAIPDRTEECSLSSLELNNWVVERLRKCGLEESLLEAYMKATGDELEKKNYDFSSYILRRHFAGVARNVMGMPIEEANGMLGHKNSCNMRDPDTRERIAHKINRFIFDPELQKNPWTRPVSLQAGSTYELGDYSGFRFKNETLTPVVITVVALSTEPGEELIVSTETDCNIKIDRQSKHVDFSETNRLVKGDTTV